MSKLYSSKEISGVLEKLGFSLVSQKGSHGKFKDNKSHIAIVPMGKKEIPQGTFRNILKQADITLDTFKEKL
jgi:predicted RNA binding protein YcfA (HicA-like mRNA interferase family)